jgi:hypothetical protein
MCSALSSSSIMRCVGRPSCDGTRGMNRKVHVSICERLGVNALGRYPTRSAAPHRRYGSLSPDSLRADRMPPTVKEDQ